MYMSFSLCIYIYIYIYYICNTCCWLCGNVKPPGTNIPDVSTMSCQAPCIMTKEFLPRLNHDMSITHKRTPCVTNRVTKVRSSP